MKYRMKSRQTFKSDIQIKVPPPENRKKYLEHPEFHFAAVMANEVEHSYFSAQRYLGKAVALARHFDPDLAENLIELATYMENCWEWLLEYQEDVLIPKYKELYPGKVQTNSEDGNEIDEEAEDENS